jgi:ATP adenylyltransferase
MSPAAKRPRAPRGALERLWAPWRMAYIGRAHGPQECLFCRVARSRADRAMLVLARRPHAFLMLNRFPYTGGHLMVAVCGHRPGFARLTAEERVDLLDLVGLAERALEAEYHPHGMNFGVNAGRVAGAGFPGHLHVHVVPRWDGDTNFMATVGETRVLPESLSRTWVRLRRAIRALEPGPGARRRARGPKKR